MINTEKLEELMEKFKKNCQTVNKTEKVIEELKSERAKLIAEGDRIWEEIIAEKESQQ